MIRLDPENRPVRVAADGDRYCWTCHKCIEDRPGRWICELRWALHGPDSGEPRTETDRACRNWTRRQAPVTGQTPLEQYRERRDGGAA